MRYSSESEATHFVEELIGKACLEARLKRVNKVMHQKQSTGYL